MVSGRSTVALRLVKAMPSPAPGPEELSFPDYNFAVFNLHVNDAGARALAIVRRMMQHPSMIPAMEALERDYRDGIMGLFDRMPDEPSRAFCVLVWTFANGLDGLR